MGVGREVVQLIIRRAKIQWEIPSKGGEGETRMHETLTNIVIPTFDIKSLQPTIFSSYQLKRSPCLDARLSDICISTSAAPTYVPAYYFKNQDPEGDVHEFNLIDGGVCANNPVYMCVNQINSSIVLSN